MKIIKLFSKEKEKLDEELTQIKSSVGFILLELIKLRYKIKTIQKRLKNEDKTRQ